MSRLSEWRKARRKRVDAEYEEFEAKTAKQMKEIGPEELLACNKRIRNTLLVLTPMFAAGWWAAAFGGLFDIALDGVLAVYGDTIVQPILLVACLLAAILPPLCFVMWMAGEYFAVKFAMLLGDDVYGRGWRNGA